MRRLLFVDDKPRISAAVDRAASGHVAVDDPDRDVAIAMDAGRG